jgi:hypothetical protein
VLEIDERGSDQAEPEREIQEQERDSDVNRRLARQRVESHHYDGPAEQASHQLDQRVAWADASFAAASLAEEQQVAEERDVVVRANQGAAAGTGRRGPDQAHAARHTVDDDVEKTAEAKTYGDGNADGEPRGELDQ